MECRVKQRFRVLHCQSTTPSCSILVQSTDDMFGSLAVSPLHVLVLCVAWRAGFVLVTRLEYADFFLKRSTPSAYATVTSATSPLFSVKLDSGRCNS